jgi:hypothetical protein
MMGHPATPLAQRRPDAKIVTDNNWEWKTDALQADGAPQPVTGWLATWPEADARKKGGMSIVHILRWLKDKASLEDYAAHYPLIKNDVLSLSQNIWHPDLMLHAYKVARVARARRARGWSARWAQITSRDDLLWSACGMSPFSSACEPLSASLLLRASPVTT